MPFFARMPSSLKRTALVEAYDEMRKADMEHSINKRRLVETFLHLVRINSPSFGEREIGTALVEMLEKAGCRAEIREYKESFNITALKGGNGGGSPLLLSGHMDTIEPTEGIRVSAEDGIIRTTGDTVLGADDKSALAQIIEAVTVLREAGIPHGDLEIVFTSAEEKGLIGAKNIDFGKLRGRHAVVLDSSGRVGNLVVAAPTHLTYEMRITGRAAHAGIEPEKGINAVRVAAEIVAGIPDGRIDAETTANVGRITGGTATNVVPKEAVIYGEVRGHDDNVLEKIKRTVFEKAASIADSKQAVIDITEQEEYKAFKLEEDDPFLRFLDDVLEKCGIEPAHIVTGGGSDANIFNERGIKTVNMSTGMRNVHSTDEHIYIDDLYKGCLVVLRAITEFGGFPEK